MVTRHFYLVLIKTPGADLGSQEGSALLKEVTNREGGPFIGRGECCHSFWEIRRGVRAKLAFRWQGALRNISICVACFSASTVS